MGIQLRMKALIRIIIPCGYVFFSNAFSQTLTQDFTKQYTVEDGLPSSLLYRVYTDNKGYIWITSNAGIARFNGLSFTRFGIEDGMPDHEVFDISEDYKGRVWFSTLRGIPGYISNNQAYSYNAIPELLEEKVSTVYARKNGEIWFGSYSNKLYQTRNDSILNIFDKLNSRVSGMREDNEGILWISTSSITYIYYFDGHTMQSIKPPTKEKIYSFSRYPVILYNKNIAFYGTNFWGIIDKKTKKPNILFDKTHFKDRIIISLFEDNDRNIWVGTNKGIDLFRNSDDDYIFERYILPDFRISSIISDFEGNYWVSTLGKGLLFIPFNPIYVYSTVIQSGSNNFTSGAISPDGEVMIANDEGIIFELKEHHLIPYFEKKTTDYIGRIIAAIKHSDGTIWFAKDDGMSLYHNHQFQNYQNFIFAKCITEDRNGHVWVGTAQGLIEYSSQGKLIQKIDIGRVTAIGKHNKGLIWYGSEYGLWEITSDYRINNIIKSDIFSYQWISDIYADSLRDILWITTYNNGLFIVKEHQVIYHINQGNGLSTSMLGNIIPGNKHNMWITSRHGAYYFKFVHGDKKIPQIIYLSTTNGLRSNEVNDMIITDSTLYVLSTNGLTVLDRNKISWHSNRPKVYIKYIYINNILQPNQAKYSMSYNNNQLRVELEGLAYQSQNRMRYKYKMLGLDTVWQYSHSPIIQYHSIPSGQYQFIVYAINIDNIESKEVIGFSLEIGFAYWQTFWFKILLGFMILIISTSTIIYRILHIKKREREKARLTRLLNDLELTALKAQMNPHFIFNSLGSIQNLINSDKKEEANVYLSKFARLLRMTLDHSDKREISLADEIAMLKLYLSLEALRFSNKFEYKIQPNTSINLFETKIPPMLLQPFLENAIKHGLLPKKSDALLIIEFSKLPNNMLHCLVRDNGIGRVQREKLKEKSQMGHISKGIKITKNRLELLNQIRNHPTEIRITDLYHENGQAAGTQVEILIPID